MTRASIAMATFNGEKYIAEQLDSILSLMAIDDEIVISDDHSTDHTISIINDYMAKDRRIKLYYNPSSGLGKNFENALVHCKGEFIFYSDQDDFWMNNKIEKCISALSQSDKALLVHDGYYTDSNLRRGAAPQYGDTLFRGKILKSKPIDIWFGLRAGTLGCCMCFRRKYIDAIVPIPNNDHDVWTINLLSHFGGVEFLYEKMILHRMHGENVSSPHRRNMIVVIMTRILLLSRVYLRMIEIKIASI